MKNCSYGYSFEFKPYLGYDKFEYDILLKDGTTMFSCYPNAGFFTSIHKDTVNKKVEYTEIDKIRFTHFPIWNITKPINPYPYKSKYENII
jgi:hypothetical protein